MVDEMDQIFPRLHFAALTVVRPCLLEVEGAVLVLALVGRVDVPLQLDLSPGMYRGIRHDK